MEYKAQHVSRLGSSYPFTKIGRGKFQLLYSWYKYYMLRDPGKDPEDCGRKSSPSLCFFLILGAQLHLVPGWVGVSKEWNLRVNAIQF